VTVTGTPRSGQTLTASPGTWTPTPTTVTYQWLRDGDPIDGATEQQYLIRDADLGHTLSVRVDAAAACTVDAEATSPALVVAAAETPSTDASPAAATPAPAVADASATLAHTGGEQPWGWGALGALMIVLGGATFALAGRMRRS
ncbi:hypothetical protein FF38_05147, partial [Lucilia cuprina]